MKNEKDEISARIGAELRRRRLMAETTQEQLAAKVGVHSNTLARYEGGDDMPVMLFIKICIALNAPVEEVLTIVLDATPEESHG